MLFLLYSAQLLSMEPWGRDADLTCRPKKASYGYYHSGPLERAMRHLVCFHKRVISPADGPRSHFKPSSSIYMLNAVEKYGFFRGYAMGCDRLMRENNDPWIYPTCIGEHNMETKWDPVP